MSATKTYVHDLDDDTLAVGRELAEQCDATTLRTVQQLACSGAGSINPQRIDRVTAAHRRAEQLDLVGIAVSGVLGFHVWPTWKGRALAAATCGERAE